MSRDPDIIDAENVGSLLGVNRKTVYAAAARGEIPHRRIGARYLFSRSAVIAWIRGSPHHEEQLNASLP